MSFPSFNVGEVLTAADMNAVGMWRVTSGITATNGTVSDGVVTVGNAVASVTVSGCFSADFLNYRIIYEGVVSSANGNMEMQLSAITGSVYQTSGTFLTLGNATVTGFGPAATTRWTLGPIGTTISTGILDLTAPRVARQKMMYVQGTSQVAYYSFAGYCNSTSTATGFVLSPNAGTLTGGTIRVYGYRD